MQITFTPIKISLLSDPSAFILHITGHFPPGRYVILKAAGPDYMVTVLVTYVTELQTLHGYRVVRVFSIVNVHAVRCIYFWTCESTICV